MQHRKIRLPSESPLGDRTLVLLHLTCCILEIFCCNLVDWLASEYLGESLVDPVLVFCASGRVPAIQTVELFSKVRMTLEYKRLKNYLNTAYVTFSPLEKRMIVFSDFLKKALVSQKKWLSQRRYQPQRDSNSSYCRPLRVPRCRRNNQRRRLNQTNHS